jgi:hypothetical protein
MDDLGFFIDNEGNFWSKLANGKQSLAICI